MDDLTSSLLEHFNRLLENVKCSLCNLKLVDAVRIKTCGHYFCKNCLQHSQSLHNCPKCLEYYEVKHLDYDNVAKQCAEQLAELELLLVPQKAKNCINYQGNEYEVVFTSKQMKLNSKGETPLHIACKNKLLERTKQLVESNVDLNAKDYAGWSPLHEAIQSGCPEIVQYLLEEKCLVNIPGPEYTTPLHQAASLDNLEIVKLLLKFGGDVDLRDLNGLKPEDCDASNAVKDILKKPHPKASNGFKVFIPSKVKLYCHSIDEETQKKFRETNVEVVSKVELGKLTHFAVKKSHKLSFKIMQAMLQGLQFVNEDFVLQQNYFIDIPNQVFLENQALNQGIQRSMMSALLKLPKLFDSINFHIEDHSKPVEIYHLKVDKEYLIKLIKAGGGKVLNRAPTPTVSTATHPYFALKDSEVYHCSNFIIYNENHPPGLLYRMKELKHKSSKWLIDCIVNYQIAD